MSNFFPEGYEKIPSNSRYMRLGEGENTFRVMSAAITGWEYWNRDKKPVRSLQKWAQTPADIQLDEEGEPTKVKHFWAFIVWNHDEKMVQILELTQKQVMSDIKRLVDSKHWGDPKNYDICVSRTGSGFNTEYSVQGVPDKKPLPPDAIDEYSKLNVNLEALFTGEDPFAAKAEDEAVDGPGHDEPAIDLGDEPPVPDRLKTVPEQFRPRA